MTDLPTQTFSLGSLISVVQRRMLVPFGPPEFYQLVAFVLIGSLPDSTMLRIDENAIEMCRMEVLRQHPWLDRIPTRPGADFHHVSVRDWAQLDVWEHRYGASHEVITMAN